MFSRSWWRLSKYTHKCERGQALGRPGAVSASWPLSSVTDSDDLSNCNIFWKDEVQSVVSTWCSHSHSCQDAVSNQGSSLAATGVLWLNFHIGHLQKFFWPPGIGELCWRRSVNRKIQARHTVATVNWKAFNTVSSYSAFEPTDNTTAC